MNIISFNQWLKSALSSLPSDLIKMRIDDVLNAPLIVVNSRAFEGSENELQYAWNTDKKTLNYPFKVFRYCETYPCPTIGRDDVTWGFIAIDAKENAFLSLFWSKDVSIYALRYVYDMQMLGDTLHMRSEPVAIFRNGEVIIPTNAQKIQTHISDINVAGCELRMIANIIYPSVHLIRVRENKPSKSVEWHQAREHYVAMRGDRDAFTVDGQVIRAPKSADFIQRAAHNRRGHFRLLRSDRYTSAKGKRIFIRDAWIGPTEWQPEGGKQIYKVMPRNPDHSVAI
jgi:hypothetical protein